MWACGRVGEGTFCGAYGFRQRLGAHLEHRLGCKPCELVRKGRAPGEHGGGSGGEAALDKGAREVEDRPRRRGEQVGRTAAQTVIKTREDEAEHVLNGFLRMVGGLHKHAAGQSDAD